LRNSSRLDKGFKPLVRIAQLRKLTLLNALIEYLTSLNPLFGSLNCVSPKIFFCRLNPISLKSNSSCPNDNSYRASFRTDT